MGANSEPWWKKHWVRRLAKEPMHEQSERDWIKDANTKCHYLSNRAANEAERQQNETDNATTPDQARRRNNTRRNLANKQRNRHNQNDNTKPNAQPTEGPANTPTTRNTLPSNQARTPQTHRPAARASQTRSEDPKRERRQLKRKQRKHWRELTRSPSAPILIICLKQNVPSAHFSNLWYTPKRLWRWNKKQARSKTQPLKYNVH